MNARPSHPLPDEAQDDRLGFVGTAGSGKTYNSCSAIERILDRGGRVIIPDPLGVWWGLRLKPDGVTPSPYKVVIFGGPHGDLPLNEHAGALIGETVATIQESCIIDLSELGTKAAERRFMLAFLTALYRNATKEPVHLAFDEADMWAPQRLLDKEGESAKLLGMMETVVRRGRVKGFIPWLITQRPAVISKDVLSQIDGLVAFRLTSQQDREAIGEWVKGQADIAQWKQLYGELATMERGQGVVWMPGRGILLTAQFPEKRTFDSSRTPKRGETVTSAELKPIDLGALKDRLSKVEAEAKANDPKALKAEIARLKREAAIQAPVASGPSYEEGKSHGYTEGRHDGYREGELKGRQIAVDILTPLLARIDGLHADMASILRDLGRTDMMVSPPTPVTKWIAPRPKVASPAPAARPNVAAGPGEKMSGAERKILTALAQYPDGRSKRQVAILTGYAANGGGFNNAMSSLRTKGWLDGRGDPLRITNAGLAALGSYEPLPSGKDLLEHWLGQLSKAERAILVELYRAYPDALTKEQLGALTGYEPNGGGFNNALSRLRTLELIEGRGEMRASEDLF